MTPSTWTPTPRCLVRQVGTAMLGYLRLVHFTREDTKDAGCFETDLFGVASPTRAAEST
ncbi:hypothetical protein [Streptomyces europaeiscabiei]|uniref:hypothetical protein n=1 Tax=Streptomyces europaeiscabiei TaxID=146819 RepID=UPI002E0E32C2|nr:hypothetical protein OHB30_48915 [Streptomyces europaeiscabiei]